MSRKRDSQTRKADLDGIRALHKLLQSIAKSPGDYRSSADVIPALNSQGSLAGFSLPSSAIHAMSLNHQKNLAALALGSFEKLDQARRAALAAIRRDQAPPPRRSAEPDQDALVAELRAEVQILKEDLFLATRAYDIRSRQARKYAAAAGPEAQALCAKEQREVDITLGLRKTAIGSTVVAHPGGKNAK